MKRRPILGTYSSIMPLLVMMLSICPSLASTAEIRQYRGEMELVSVTGTCSYLTSGKKLTIDFVLKRDTTSKTEQISGYFSAPNVQLGYFYGNDLSSLRISYPQELTSAEYAHTLTLSLSSDTVRGVLREKYLANPAACAFDNATLTLNTVSTGNAEAEYLQKAKLFSAKRASEQGLALLKAGKAREALPYFTESLSLRNEVDRNAPDKLYPVLYSALAHTLLKQGAQAIDVTRNLLNEKLDGNNTLKLRMTLPVLLCDHVKAKEPIQLHNAALHLLDTLSREFSTVNGFSFGLGTCYRELGDARIDEDDSEGALQYFQEALKLNPEDITAISKMYEQLSRNGKWSEARKIIEKHASAFKEVGEAEYQDVLALTYILEGKAENEAEHYEQAAQLFATALTISPDKTEAIGFYSRAMSKLGKNDELRAVLKNHMAACRSDECRTAYSAELDRQALIEKMVKKLQ